MTTNQQLSAVPPILLVPGYWLGAWAWSAVAARLAEHGYRAEAVTLPGLESAGASRASVTFADHVACVAERVRAIGTPVVLVAHSGAGAIATAVADRMPEALARIIYVDSGPVADGTIPRPDLADDATELPFPGLDALAVQGASIDGLTEADRVEFTARAVPHPAGACREPVVLNDPRRNSVAATAVCCSLSGAVMRELAASGDPMFAPVDDLADLTVVDLPTGHWPMLSRPDDLADLIAAEADRG